MCSICNDVKYCVRHLDFSWWRLTSDPAPQNDDCQMKDWRAHKPNCDAHGLQYEVPDSLMKFAFVKVPRTLWERGAVSPISRMIGVPVRVIPKPDRILDRPFLVQTVMRTGEYAGDVLVRG